MSLLVCATCCFGTGAAMRVGGLTGFLDLGAVFVIKMQVRPWAAVSGPYVDFYGLFLSELTF